MYTYSDVANLTHILYVLSAVSSVFELSKGGMVS